MNKEKNIEKITVEYDTEDRRVVEKGVIMSFEHNNDKDTDTVIFDMCHITGHDLRLLVSAVIEMADRLGMLDGLEVDE